MDKINNTGRKDKLGFYIYEGDLLSLSYGIPPTEDKLKVYWNKYKKEWWVTRLTKTGLNCPLAVLNTEEDCYGYVTNTMYKKYDVKGG